MNFLGSSFVSGRNLQNPELFRRRTCRWREGEAGELGGLQPAGLSDPLLLLLPPPPLKMRCCRLTFQQLTTVEVTDMPTGLFIG